MKISKLHIDQFRHLENLDFDFTYPEDFHIEEKRGKPLDKICFIGQSATGKTGLLDLFFDYINYTFNCERINKRFIGARFNAKNLDGILEFSLNNKNKSNIKLQNDSISIDDNIYVYENGNGGKVDKLIPLSEVEPLYYFKANILSEENLKSISTHPNDLYEKNKEYIDSLNTVSLNTLLPQQSSYVFDNNIDEKIWLKVLNEYIIYLKNFTQKMSELIHQGLLSDSKKLEKEYKIWENDNPKKLLDFAEKLNPILIKLGLEIDTVDTRFAVPIKNIRKDEVIQISNLSTGTKQLLLTSLPLYQLNTKDSIILIDEPERSLFPDIQMELMDHYKNLAPEAQFIVATHSPFIAASFEPEERFILYFDKEGKVAVRRGTSPIGDDPNDILFNDFGVNYYNEDVQGKFKEYIELLDKVKSEDNKELKKKYILEASKLGNQYNFILDEKNQERLQ
ncbi:AAA ATPase domain-containing protein [Flavobacterium sp. CF108]|uniref:AAA family ATPase n=1 Tax=unclassified Flavobacterium TaxID=196869 RepID=UPI0008CEAD3D|nr:MULTISPECIES: ATP-binding protein [unclassified Flavobacterium]SEO53119.1 AAA domain-containing protein, putative AbiEii toxin, Type IV TA system [Flavobacterium sp. fv08]SHH74654.1 AAA ATPase domain-containing protein [Flavobacterium sp. CF108]